MTTTQPATGTAAQAGRPSRRLGLALLVIAAAQLMVVLDATIVNVALPHIQRALGFSGSGLEWVVNAYVLAFGGLLLLGGRAGDLLGRRRVFVAGLLVFSAASLGGGLATSQAWLLAARTVQGAAAAVIAPASLALVGTTFAEGRPRNRAMAVYAAVSISGAVIGLIAGGLLTTYASWRWVLFVNAPLGALAVLAAPLVLTESGRQRGQFDLPGAVTGTAGITALVYGLSNAATTPDGVSHWGDVRVLVSLAAAAVLLATFAVIEARSRHALVPVRLLADRNRVGAYLVTLCLGTALLGMFFFLTLFMQVIWGYSALKTGLAYLPEAAAGLAGSGAAAWLIPRVGARRLLLASSLTAAAGLIWMSRLGEHSTYASGLLGPTLITGAALGLIFVPLSLITLSGAGDQDSGAASSLLNAGEQVGGAVGLAVLGAVAWTVTAGSLRAGAARAAAAVTRTGHQTRPRDLPMTAIYHHALAAGFSRGLLVAAGIMLLAVAIAAAVIRTGHDHPSNPVSSRAVPGPDDTTAIPAR